MGKETNTPGREEQAKKVLEDILGFLEMDADVTLGEDDEDRALLNIDSPDNQLLIGKRGQTLDALQFIVTRIVGRTHPGGKRIIVDCEDYRERRAEQLKLMARQVADKVKGEKVPYAFDATLTPAERRIVHMELKEEPEVFTRSEGDNDRRRLVVMPRQSDDDE